MLNKFKPTLILIAKHSNLDDVVCPDGTCAENEIMCKALKKYLDKFPYLCFCSFCQNDFSDCPANIFCEDFKSLYEDHICREPFDKELSNLIWLFSYNMKKSKISKS